MSNPIATEFFNKMKSSFMEKVSEEEREKYRKFGEQFYNSFDVNNGNPINPTICMEESLAYVVESLKSGLHPKYLTLDEATLVRAGYGEEWYKKWGYEENEIPNEFMK